jgi:DNA uptake protein ComE-like DNA-binding protein
MNLNTAPVADLASLASVGWSRAYDLDLWRPFASWGEVAEVPGFGPSRAVLVRASGAHLSVDQRTSLAA